MILRRYRREIPFAAEKKINFYIPVIGDKSAVFESDYCVYRQPLITEKVSDKGFGFGKFLSVWYSPVMGSIKRQSQDEILTSPQKRLYVHFSLVTEHDGGISAFDQASHGRHSVKAS